MRRGLRLAGTGVVLLSFQVVVPSRPEAQPSSWRCPVEEAVLLLKDGARQQPTVEWLLRLLPAAFGLSEEIPFGLRGDSLVVRLKLYGLIPKDTDVDLQRLLTHGEASFVLVGALMPSRGSLLERLWMWLADSREASCRIATREGLVPKGQREDRLTTKQLAAVMVAVTHRSRSRAPTGAAIPCIDVFASRMLEEVVTAKEVGEILGPAGPRPPGAASGL